MDGQGGVGYVFGTLTAKRSCNCNPRAGVVVGMGRIQISDGRVCYNPEAVKLCLNQKRFLFSFSQTKNERRRSQKKV